MTAHADGRDHPTTETVEPAAPPVRTTDRRGRRIRFVAYRPEWFDALVALYCAFDDDGRAQGVPPRGESAVRSWLEGVVNDHSVVARHDGAVVGHVLFVPDGEGAHELAAFVDERYRAVGVGTTLVRTGLGHAADHGIDEVWLVVERSNNVARRLYRRVGFDPERRRPGTIRMSRRL